MWTNDRERQQDTILPEIGKCLEDILGSLRGKQFQMLTFD